MSEGKRLKIVQKVDYLVLGAGPAGLSFANRLQQQYPEKSFLVLEREETAGGLCRSAMVDGTELDIGGGHFLDVRRPKVNEFLFQFMPQEEWNLFDRDSRIDMGSYETGHPFEANIWQMPEGEQVKYLKSIAVAGCNLDQPMPEKFVEWIEWKLGKRVAEEYMIPYNQKMFGGDLNELGTYWLNKLPNVSFEETLLSCLNKKPYGTQPGHAQFYYPKEYGYGELWLRMAKALGENILYNKSVTELDLVNKQVVCEDGSVYQGERIITTIPWRTIQMIHGCAETVRESIRELKHTGTEIKYVPDNLDTEAQWIYVPDINISYHRILVRHNFCTGSKGYWVETNLNRITEDSEGIAFRNEYTYPLNTIRKPQIMKELLSYMRERGIYGLGRWGEHEHYNSDLTVELAMNLCDELTAGENRCENP